MISMKKTLTVALVTIVLFTFCTLPMVSCGSGSGFATVDGTYYEFIEVDGVINEEVWYRLDNGNWSNSDGAKGEFTASGEVIVLMTEINGEETEFATGTVVGKNLELVISGETILYVLK